MTQPDDMDPIGERIRATVQSVSAPMSLRASIEREPERRRATNRYPGRLQLLGIGATLAIIATMAGILAPGGPTVQTVAAAALHQPERTGGPAWLPGFEPIGRRTDTVSGRTARTTIYTRGSVGIHYTIVDGKPLDLPGKRTEDLGAYTVWLARDGKVSLVSWHAGGKTCILASKSASADQMVALLKQV